MNKLQILQDKTNTKKYNSVEKNRVKVLAFYKEQKQTKTFFRKSLDGKSFSLNVRKLTRDDDMHVVPGLNLEIEIFFVAKKKNLLLFKKVICLVPSVGILLPKEENLLSQCFWNERQQST